MKEIIKNIHTVSSLTYEIKNLFEINFAAVEVKGEVSNLKKGPNGHIYFTLKDSSSAISVALFASSASSTLLPKDGDEIIVSGEISVYPPRGSYQIIAKKISKTGTGDLLMKFHLLKEELEKKGYFAKQRKKPLPKFPKKIGVVTSPTGAVIQDIIQVLSRRYPNFNLILNPVAVQGVGAEIEIAKAIEDFNTFNLVDVIIVGRGGGSLEDLFSFNQKIVADAIFHSNIPIISACGHETDFTIADFVADVRAPTPSAAAEIVVVDKILLYESLKKLKNNIFGSLKTFILQYKTSLKKISENRYFTSPYSILSLFIQKLDEITAAIDKASLKNIRIKKAFMEEKIKVYNLFSPITKINSFKEKVKSLQMHLLSVHPENLLKKGYSLIFIENTKKIISSYKQLENNQKIYIQLSDGSAIGKIETVKEK
jgi:exodeoxyribonuclease VII large subunit